MVAWTVGAIVVCTIVANLVYPTIIRCLQGEFRTDEESPSGLAEAIAWKSHAYLVRSFGTLKHSFCDEGTEWFPR
jgi:hypothetical protein